MEEVIYLSDILKTYELAFVQKINLDKSKISWGLNIISKLMPLKGCFV